VDFGPKPDQFGYLELSTGSTMGPCSFAVDRDERIYVADPMKKRIVVFHNGVMEREIKIDRAESVDLRIFPRGDLVVTTYPSCCLSIIDRQGKKRFGAGRQNIDILLQADGEWAYGIRKFVKLLDSREKRTDGRLSLIPRRTPSRDGKWLITMHRKPENHYACDIVLSERNPTLNDRGSDIPASGHGNAAGTRVKELEFDCVLDFVSFGTDEKGRIHVLSSHSCVDTATRVKDYLTTLSPDLEVIRQISIPSSHLNTLDNTERTVDFTADGDVYFLSVSDHDKRAIVTRYRWTDVRKKRDYCPKHLKLVH